MKRVLDDLNVFCAVVEKGSMKQASELLGIPHSTVSRRIDALEQALGLHLLQRTTREVRVTSRGQQLYQDCSPLLASLSSSVDAAIDDEVQFKGSLNVSMPLRAGLDFLGSWLIDFASEHPELKLSLSLTNTNLNLVQDNVDLAFRVGPLVDSSAIAMRLWDIPYVLCASKGYVQRHQLNPEQVEINQLAQLPAVVSLPARSWTLIEGNFQQHAFEPLAHLVVDDLALAYHAVQGGQVMAMLPLEMLSPTSLESGELQLISIPGYHPRTRSMFAYYQGKRHSDSQIRHVVDYVRMRHASKLEQG